MKTLSVTEKARLDSYSEAGLILVAGLSRRLTRSRLAWFLWFVCHRTAPLLSWNEVKPNTELGRHRPEFEVQFCTSRWVGKWEGEFPAQISRGA